MVWYMAPSCGCLFSLLVYWLSSMPTHPRVCSYSSKSLFLNFISNCLRDLNANGCRRPQLLEQRTSHLLLFYFVRGWGRSSWLALLSESTSPCTAAHRSHQSLDERIQVFPTRPKKPQYPHDPPRLLFQAPCPAVPVWHHWRS